MRLFLYTFDLGNRLKHMTFKFLNRNRQVVGSTPTRGSTYHGIAMVTNCRGIRLTEAQRLNYGSSMRAMARNSEMLTGASETRGRVAVCLLLIALLLYNPFFTVLSISQDLSVQHPLSYRATVAGSELRRCTIGAGKPLLPALSAAIFSASALFAPSHEVALVQPGDIVAPVPQALCGSIWFRPPPSA
jgi:hypothetical protein